MSPLPEDEHERLLVEQARSDVEAFRELYRMYFPRVYRYVAYRLSSVSEVEDIVSEVFLRSIEKIRSFRYQGPGSFAAWLFAIAHNLVIDSHRRKWRSMVKLDDANKLDDISLPPDLIAVRNEESRQLYQALRTLSKRRQEVIGLRFFGGLRNQEIALVLGIGERAVASHLSRGLRDLHVYLQSEISTASKEHEYGQLAKAE